MRAAICIYGVVGGAKDKAYAGDSKAVLEMGHKYYKENVLDVNDDVDIYIHSWSTNMREQILELYKPTNYIIEKQKIFHKDKRTQNHYSRWYSSMKTVELAQEKEYDFIFLTRFDIAWQTHLLFNELKKDKFYVANWCTMHNKNRNSRDLLRGGRGEFYKWKKKKQDQCTHKHKGWPKEGKYGVLDWWFLSNQENMNRFADFYNVIGKYEKHQDTRKQISSHFMLPKYFNKLELTEHIEQKYHLWDDFPLIRRRYFGCKK
jgi:hypothetical protein